jgi:hypothetical protein
MRKAAIDFGIRITFKHLDMVHPGETAMRDAYSAFAVIEYPEVQSGGKRQRGYLLYIKPYRGGMDEPADVRAYGRANPAFPHDSTFDQFFGEAQFESYRALGSYTVMELGRRAGFAATSQATKPADLTHFFEGAQLALRQGDKLDKLRRDFFSVARPMAKHDPISVSDPLRAGSALGPERNNA